LLQSDDYVQIMDVIRNTPAAGEVVSPGDKILSINGIAAPKGRGAVKKTQDLLKKEFETGRPVSIVVDHLGKQIQATIKPQWICNFPPKLDLGRDVNAYADGEKIVVYRGLLNFMPKDEDLALVLAHETAHNVMGHVEAMKRNAMVGGLIGAIADAVLASQGYGGNGDFSNLGANMAVQRYSADFEREADYVGLYVMARTGYDITNAADMWRRMATLNPESISRESSHPSTAERFVAIDQTVLEIKDKKARNQPLMPNMQKKP
jgi:Zn-dependent protease with chaperone function